MAKYKEIFGITKERFAPKIDLHLTYEKMILKHKQEGSKVQQHNQCTENNEERN